MTQNSERLEQRLPAAFEVFMQAGQEQYRDYFENRLLEIDKQLAALQPQQ